MNHLQQSEVLPLIRSLVRDRLTRSAAFQQLDPHKRAEVAHDTVNALHYILGGEDGTSIPSAVTMGGNAEAFAPPPLSDGTKTKEHTKFGGAADKGITHFKDLAKNVDFPGFVGGLVDGVFNSIVTSSIKQMEAYAEMVKNVSKSVDQYMKDNVTEDHARDYLAERYPDHFEVDVEGDAPRLRAKEGADETNMPDFLTDLGMQFGPSSLDDDAVEQELVPAARRRIAMDRQQLLATMVMMGINRLVVTNGTIEASCFFELDTTDQITEHDESEGQQSNDPKAFAFASSSKKATKYAKRPKITLGKASLYAGSPSPDVKFKMSTSSTRDSEQTLKMHAELGGKVKINFKSDFFPMEKMVDILQVNQIREKTSAGIAPQIQPQQPAIPALPPLPALPPAPSLPTAAPAAARPPAPRTE